MMKFHRLVYGLLAMLAVSFIFMNGCLLRQNVDYRSANRHLILQNDSLIGLIIDMNHKMRQVRKDSSLIRDVSQNIKK